MIEKRYVVGIEDLQAIELVCAKKGCGAVIRVDLGAAADLSFDEQKCPRCKMTWWTLSPGGVPTPLADLLLALARHRPSRNSSEPFMKLVFPLE